MFFFFSNCHLLSQLNLTPNQSSRIKFLEISLLYVKESPLLIVVLILLGVLINNVKFLREKLQRYNHKVSILNISGKNLTYNLFYWQSLAVTGFKSVFVIGSMFTCPMLQK